MTSPLLRRLIGATRGNAAALRPLELSPGAVFRHRPDFGAVEYAEIIDVGPDPVGIRHVRFRLYFGYRDKTVEAGERTLAAVAFARRFAERIGGPQATASEHGSTGNG